MTCFTKVQVRNDQGFFFLPEHRPVSRKPELMIPYFV
jgi:hypothetical protein